jgi:hypothetical protein
MSWFSALKIFFVTKKIVFDTKKIFIATKTIVFEPEKIFSGPRRSFLRC